MSLFTLRFETVSNSGTWVYRLALAPKIEEVTEEAGLLERAGKDGLGRLVAHLSSWLDIHDGDLEMNSEVRTELWYLLSDANLMEPGKFTELLELVDTGQPTNWPAGAWSNERLIASLPIYKAISLVLGAGDRFITLNSSLAYLFAVWQWFNCAKHLTISLAIEEHSPLIDELARAHRLLVELIDDQRFAQAIRWLASWAEISTKSGPLTRERLRLSLPLIWANQGAAPGMPYFVTDPRNVLPAPGFNGTEPLDWSQVRLHPVFFNHRFASARAAVRSLITDWLLPRYDFKSTLFLARLLKSNQPRPKAHLFWQPPLAWLGLIIASIILGSFMTVQASLGYLPIFPWSALGWVSIAIGVIVIRKSLDSSIFPYLVLPRLLGGILIGYSALVLESHAFLLSDVIVQLGFPVVAMLWLGVLAVSWFYLYYDSRPLVLLEATAARRSGFTLALALLAAMMLGLPAVALATGAWLADSINSCVGICFFGPFGRVNLHLYVTYVPLALFTGMITQFIFEERTVTASVWAPEEK